jgi:flagellar hook-basal body complex protein FliE
MVDQTNFILPGKIQSTVPSGGSGVQSTGGADGKDFKQMLMENLDQVNKLQQEAQTATEQLATGKTENVAEVFSAVRKADIAFSLLMQIRNQLVDAYTEIRNIRI